MMIMKLHILHGSLDRRALYRTFFIAAAFSVVSFMHIMSGSYVEMFNYVTNVDCASQFGNLELGKTRFLGPIWGAFDGKKCKEDVNLTVTVVRELMGKNFLNGDKALCVGQGFAASAVMALQDLGFPNARGVDEQRFFSLGRKRFVYEIDYEDGSFDFVLCKDLDKVSIPAMLVLEVERVLSPGGIAAMLVGSGGLAPSSLIRSATPISSLLKSSSVVHVNYIGNLTLVVFRKNYENAGLFQQYRLPNECQSMMNNRPFIEKMEPLVMETGVPLKDVEMPMYLPNVVDVSSKKRLVYIDIGAAEHLKSNATSWFLPSYPITQTAFHVYFVDHNTSVLLLYVKNPGISFVYHPGLAGVKEKNDVEGEAEEPYIADEGFDFLDWFKETVQHAEFVVLKMNAGNIELKFLRDLFESGAICYVDELFLHCSGHIDREGRMPVDCMDIFKSLRSSGVYVHQWWAEDSPVDIL